MKNRNKVELVTDANEINRILKQKYGNMFSRTHRECVWTNQPCYSGVTVSDEWIGKEGFENFKKYITETTGVYRYDGRIAHLDKDLLWLCGEPKQYGEGKSLLIPAHLNMAIEQYTVKDYQISYDPYVYTIKIGKREAKTKTYDDALAQFCEWRASDWKKIIEMYEDTGLPEIVMNGIYEFDVYGQNGLNKADWA